MSLRDDFKSIGINLGESLALAGGEDSSSEGEPLGEGKKFKTASYATGKVVVKQVRTGAKGRKARKAGKKSYRRNKAKIARRRTIRARSAVGRKIAARKASNLGKSLRARTEQTAATSATVSESKADGRLALALGTITESAGGSVFEGAQDYIDTIEMVTECFDMLALRFGEAGRASDAETIEGYSSRSDALLKRVRDGSMTAASVNEAFMPIMKALEKVVAEYETPDFISGYLEATAPLDQS